MIGHGEKFCERLFDTTEMIEKPYGAWIRAEPRRRMKNIGAKWLRPGGISLKTSAGEKDGASSNKLVTVFQEAVTCHGEKSRVMGNDVRHEIRVVVQENKGGRTTINLQFQNDVQIRQAKNRQEAGKSVDGENNEMVVIELKRCRLGQMIL